MAGKNRTPLVEVPHGDAVVAVLRDEDDGWLWLSSDSRRRGGTGISHYGAFAQGSFDRWVVGGALPPGASRAQVLEDSGGWVEAKAANGAWVVVLTGSRSYGEHVVRYLDDSGAIVNRPLPTGTKLAPVPDASEPCVACGGQAWNTARGSLEMLVPERWRDHPDDDADHRTVICARCGHQEAVGAFISVGLDDSDDPWPAEEDVPGQEQAEAARELAEGHALLSNPLRDVAFPVYGLDSSWRGSRTLGGSGASDGRLDSVTLDHGSRDDGTWVSIRTDHPDADDLGEPPVQRAEEAYSRVIERFDESWPRLSEEALTLWLQARDRERRTEVVATKRRQAQINVDGTTVSFTVIGSSERWAGSADYDELYLTVEAAGLAPDALRLVPIDDPASYAEASLE